MSELITMPPLYLLAHVPLAAAAPAFYTVFTPVNTAIFAWTRNLEICRFTQLLLNLILPWLVTIALGGFGQSSVVIIWAALCVTGRKTVGERRLAAPPALLEVAEPFGDTP